MKEEKNYSFFILNFLIFLAVVLYQAYIARYGAFNGESAEYGIYYYGEKLFDPLFRNAGKLHGGGYFCLFITKFMSFGIPLNFGFHPADFVGYPQGIFRGIVLAMTMFSISSFVEFFKSNEYLRTALFAILSTSYFLFYRFSIAEFGTSNHNFYRYILSVLFFCVFFKFIFNNALFKSKSKIWHILILSVFAVILGSNLETIIFSTVTISLLLWGYNIVVNLLSKKKSDASLKKIYSYSLRTNFYIPVICLLLTVLVYFCSEGMQFDLLEYRGFDTIKITPALVLAFLSDFVKLYILQNPFIEYWTAFAGLLVGAFCLGKKENLKEILLPIFMQIGSVISLLLLIFCGKSLYQTGHFWLEHFELRTVSFLMFLCPLFMLLSFVLKNMNENKSKIVAYSMTVILLIISVIEGFNIRENHFFSSLQKLNKEANYISEKIMRFYALHGEIPVLPDLYIFEQTAYYEKNYPESNYITDCLISIAYYPQIYNDDRFIKEGYYTSEKALDKFYQKGGAFYENELRNPIFQNLKNDNFVLNKEFDVNDEVVPISDIKARFAKQKYIPSKEY